MTAPLAEAPTGADYLRALIRSEGGSIPLERFMQEALYHPHFGYYSRRVRHVGRAGDFSTSATLHPALGQAIAAWAASHRAEVFHRRQWHLIELGGGGGQTAAAILRSIPWWTRRGLRYHLIEISTGLRSTQRDALSRFGPRVQWHETIRSALAAAGGRALIFSNEYVDAFPCVQLVRVNQPDDWGEVHVRWPDDQANPGETVAPWRGPSPGVEAVAGQRVETHHSYRRWLEDAITGWKVGRLLTVDYGDVPPALYDRRPNGTLRAYCRHQRLTGPEVYARFGQQDLTVDVNFDDLQRWGGELGLTNLPLSTQADFLRRWLPASALRRTDTDPALSYLLDPAGAGGAFKVLEQARRPFPQTAP